MSNVNGALNTTTTSNITWFPTSKEIKPSSVWANMPNKGLDRYVAPRLSEIRDIAKMTGNPKRVSREDIEAFRHQTPLADDRADLVMAGYKRAASSDINGLRVVGRHLGNAAHSVGQFFGVLFGGFVPGSG